MFYIFQVILGMITPVLSLVFLPVYKTQKLQVVVISSFITVFFVFFKPLEGYDLLVHYQNFIDYQAGVYELFNRYVGIDILIYVISHLGLEKNSLVFVTSFMIFYATYKFVDFKSQENKLILVFLLTVACYPLVLLISGVRFSLAISFFLLSDIFFSRKKYIRYVIFAALAILFHYAASVLIFVYLAAKFFKIERINTKLLAVVLILLLPLMFYQSLLIQIIFSIMRTIGFEQYVGLDLSRYVSGEWGAMRSSSYNINGLLGYFLPKIFLCVLGFFYLVTCKEKDSFIIILFAIVLLLFNFGDIGDRYAICLVPFLTTSLMNSANNISLRKFPLPLIFILCYVALNLFKEYLLYGVVYMHLIESTLFFKSPLLLLIGGFQ